MAPKRPAASDETVPSLATKHLKAEELHASISPPLPTPDFSTSVKKKLSSSSRTGQACDRCKVRKIRCDARATGCSPCLQNNVACTTTDRITKRATTRGHTETLEQENDTLRQTIAELEAQVRDLKGDRESHRPCSPYGQPTNGAWQSNGASPRERQTIGQQTSYCEHNTGGSLSPRLESLSLGALPTFKAGCVGDNYLGISSAHSILSPIKGTSLSFFGAEIDLTEFAPVDADDMNAPTSYHTFLRVALGKQPAQNIPFPPEAQVAQYASWYFRSLHPYTPILHKPSFRRMLHRLYHDQSFTPSAAETVQVHMLVASLKYQISIRNANTELMAEAHQHYLYSISLVSDLLLHHALEDMQALTMIAIHLRNFPKPGAAWFASQIALSVAIELGLHRSSKAWADTTPTIKSHEIELRKRIFWTIFNLLVGLCGRLGRPVPLRLEDLDVGMPQPENDTEDRAGQPVVNFSDCSFQIGLCAPGIAVITCKMYSTIYAIRQSAQTYERIVRQLDDDIRTWRRSLPAEFTLESHVDQENYIFVRYLHTWEQEARLLLHHPALCRSNDPDFVSRNLEICLDASKQMLRVVSELREYKSVDIPWVNVTVYLAAIFTTLFIYTQHRQDMSASELDVLRSDMSKWRNILNDVGACYGTGDKLANAVSNIVERSLSNLSARITQRTAAAAITGSVSQRQSTQGSEMIKHPDLYHSINVGHERAPETTRDTFRHALIPSAGQVPFAATDYSQQTPQAAFRDSSNPRGSSTYTGPLPERSRAAEQRDQKPLAQSAVHDEVQQRSHSLYELPSSTAQQPSSSTRMTYPDGWQEWTQQNVVANLNGSHLPAYSPVMGTGLSQHPRISAADPLLALNVHSTHQSILPSSSTTVQGGTITDPASNAGPYTLDTQGLVPSHLSLESPAHWPVILNSLQYGNSAGA